MTSIPGVHIGDVLGGKYEVVDLIGKGGMGVVLECVHRGLGQRVAVKVLRRDPRHDAELFARFEREARAAAQLKSRHTVNVTDVDYTDDGTPFMVMELLEGHDLDTEIARQGRIEVKDAVTYVLQTCTAMAEAHAQGIIHRDLKPQNLFLCHEGNDTIIKVLDFGISKIVDEAANNITQTASALGTPLYMSPEQIRSAKHVDGRTDIWALGVILYELLSGRPPFDADNPAAIIAAIIADTATPLYLVQSDVPRGLSDVVMRALEKRPVDRFEDIPAFAAALAPFGEPSAFARPSMRSLSDAISRRDMSAPGLAATQRSDTHGSWETTAFRRSFARSTWPVALGAVLVLGMGAAGWLATRTTETQSVTERGDRPPAGDAAPTLIESAPAEPPSASASAAPAASLSASAAPAVAPPTPASSSAPPRPALPTPALPTPAPPTKAPPTPAPPMKAPPTPAPPAPKKPPSRL